MKAIVEAKVVDDGPSREPSVSLKSPMTTRSKHFIAIAPHGGKSNDIPINRRNGCQGTDRSLFSGIVVVVQR
jgi:hypothetical protein